MPKDDPYIKRSIMLKAEPTEIDSNISHLFDNTFGKYVQMTLEHIDSLYNTYTKIEPVEKVCNICKQKKHLFWQNIDKEKICSSCFNRTWSDFTLLKTFKPQLVKMAQARNIPVAHSGYYYGAVLTGAKIFKSFIAKHTKREEEISKAKEQYVIADGKLSALDFDIKKTKSDINLGKNLTTRLAELEKEKIKLERDLKQYGKKSKLRHVSFPIFRNNEVFFGAKGMFGFKKDDEGYSLWISDYKMLRNKIPFRLKIGSLKKYHKVCKKEITVKENLYHCQSCNTFVPKKECVVNHQEHFILKCMEKGEHKIVYPRMIRREIKKGYEYYFILPTRDISEAKMMSSQKIIDWIKQDKEIEFCCLSFGIKTPVTLAVIKSDKIKAIKTFGDGYLYQRNEVERKIRGDIYNGISEKFRHEHPHKEKDKVLHQNKRKALRESGKKIGFRHQRFCNYYNQKLSHDVVDYIKNNCNKPLIIFRDTKGLKEFSYKGELMRRLSRWDIAQQKVFIEYKSYLNNIPILKQPYRETKSVKCSRCLEETKEKVITQILNFEKMFVCQKCKYSNDFLVNDGINLYHSVKNVSV